MAELDHWHPVLLSAQLKTKPVAVQLAGQHLAVFRTATGKLGAVAEMCPHRRMKLSQGCVVGEKLQCKYHGWTFTADGVGESPSTPKLHACAHTYDIREEQGAIWVKSKHSNPVFPKFEVAGFIPAGATSHVVNSTLEVAMDNFCEIEHTPTAHALFGYPLERMEEVAVRFEPTPTTVTVRNLGPSKPFPWHLRRLIGMRKGWQFHDDWTTHFSPLYSVYDHWWSDPVTGRESKIRWRLYMFYWPIHATQVNVTSFAFIRNRLPVPDSWVKPFTGILLHLFKKEVDLDVAIIEGLASHEPSLAGMKLSRFDRALGLNRERVAKLYRGVPAGRMPLDCVTEELCRSDFKEPNSALVQDGDSKGAA